jgi:hypothetical protein
MAMLASWSLALLEAGTKKEERENPAPLLVGVV